MLDSPFAQPLQNRPLCGFALVKQSVIHVASLFGLGLQTIGSTQVGLISEHNEKLGLLTIGSMFHHPGCDLLRRRKNALDGTCALALPAGTRRSDGSNESYSSCNEEQ